MSRDPGDALPPRRPRPGSNNPDGSGGELTTFRPANPARPGAKPGRADGAPGRTSPRAEAGGPNLFERVVFGRIGAGHLATFCRQASAYLDAGVDLNKALGSLRQQFARTALGPVLERIQGAVRRGDPLSEAMAREPQAFDSFFLSMVRMAEVRGAMPEVLRRMAKHYEDRRRLLRQARSALIYPVTVLAIAVGVIGLLTAYVLPKLVAVLADMTRGRNVQLPAVTRALMALGRFVQGIGFWLVPLVLVGGGFLLTRYYRTRAGKAMIDEFGLNVPVFGTLLRKLDTARFARTLASLLDAGVDYGTALDLTADVVRLDPFRRAVRVAKTSVLEGSELSTALQATRRFDPDVIGFIETGEGSGKLPESLEKLADEYEEQVEHLVKNLGQLLQPLISILLGGFVLFIVLGFVMAYIQVITDLAGGRL